MSEADRAVGFFGMIGNSPFFTAASMLFMHPQRPANNVAHGLLAWGAPGTRLHRSIPDRPTPAGSFTPATKSPLPGSPLTLSLLLMSHAAVIDVATADSITPRLEYCSIVRVRYWARRS